MRCVYCTRIGQAVEAEFSVHYNPACPGHVVLALREELGPQPDGRKGSTAIPVGLVVDQ